MASQPIYQFYAQLAEYEPALWRRFQVMNATTMAKLAYVLMTMFEMQGSHAFCFYVPEAENFRKSLMKRRGIEPDWEEMGLFADTPIAQELCVELPSDDDFSEFDGSALDARDTKVRNLLNTEGQTMRFAYDYGDGWEVSLVLEKILEDKELPGKELPRVLEGAGYGIIDDCGGPGGLEEIAKAFQKKHGPQYRQYCEWLEVEELDLAAFDLEDINFRLKKIPRIYADLYEYDLEPTRQSMALLTREYKRSPK